MFQLTQPIPDRIGIYSAPAEAQLAQFKKDMFRRDNYEIPKSYVDQIPDLLAKEGKFNYQARE